MMIVIIIGTEPVCAQSLHYRQKQFDVRPCGTNDGTVGNELAMIQLLKPIAPSGCICGQLPGFPLI